MNLRTNSCVHLCNDSYVHLCNDSYVHLCQARFFTMTFILSKASKLQYRYQKNHNIACLKLNVRNGQLRIVRQRFFRTKTTAEQLKYHAGK